MRLRNEHILGQSGKSVEQMKREARIDRMVRESFEYACNFFIENLDKKPFEKIDKNHPFLLPKLATSVHAQTLNYFPNAFQISFSVDAYQKMIDLYGEEDTEIEKAFIAYIVFHEFTHHIQHILGELTSPEARGHREDNADYFSGFLFARYVKENKISIRDAQRVLTIVQMNLRTGDPTLGKLKTKFGDVAMSQPLGLSKSVDLGHSNSSERSRIIDKGFFEYPDFEKMEEFFEESRQSAKL